MLHSRVSLKLYFWFQRWPSWLIQVCMASCIHNNALPISTPFLSTYINLTCIHALMESVNEWVSVISVIKSTAKASVLDHSRCWWPSHCTDASRHRGRKCPALALQEVAHAQPHQACWRTESLLPAAEVIGSIVQFTFYRLLDLTPLAGLRFQELERKKTWVGRVRLPIWNWFKFILI